MGLRLVDLAGRWAGETVYVVGSSAAWKYLDARFFDDKRTIAINFVGPTFDLAPTAVTVTQYGQMPEKLRALGWDGIVVAPDRIVQNRIEGTPRYEADENTVRYLPPPKINFHPFLRYWPDGPEHLFTGTTSLHAAMHLAYRMGAATIVTVAADHGFWDGETNPPGYETNAQQTRQLIAGHWPAHTNELAAHLRTLGCNVYSMIPAVNLNLEGATFEGPRARIGV
jgi:hypothetical protein